MKTRTAEMVESEKIEVTKKELQTIIKGIENTNLGIYISLVLENKEVCSNYIKDIYNMINKKRKVVGYYQGKKVFQLGNAFRISGRYNKWHYVDTKEQYEYCADLKDFSGLYSKEYWEQIKIIG